MLLHISINFSRPNKVYSRSFPLVMIFLFMLQSKTWNFYFKKTFTLPLLPQFLTRHYYAYRKSADTINLKMRLARHLSLPLQHGFRFSQYCWKLKLVPPFLFFLAFSQHGRYWRTLQTVWNPCRCERESRRGEPGNISNQIKHGADSVTWKWSQTVYRRFMQT